MFWFGLYNTAYLLVWISSSVFQETPFFPWAEDCGSVCLSVTGLSATVQPPQRPGGPVQDEDLGGMMELGGRGSGPLNRSEM